jgi:uncharacterized protein YjiS (DUF1127 family)
MRAQTLATTATHTARDRVSHPFVAAYKALAQQIKTLRQNNRARTELHSLSDRELSDIGVNRADIDHVITHGTTPRRHR